MRYGQGWLWSGSSHAWASVTTMILSARRNLLGDNRLHQVPRMVDVVSLVHRYVVREQLQRNDFHNWQKQFGRCGHIEHVIGDLADFLITLGGHRYQRTPTGFHFLHYFQGSP